MDMRFDRLIHSAQVMAVAVFCAACGVSAVADPSRFTLDVAEGRGSVVALPDWDLTRGPLIRVFGTLTNSGNSEVRITGEEMTCKCLRATLSAATVPPGGSVNFTGALSVASEGAKSESYALTLTPDERRFEIQFRVRVVRRGVVVRPERVLIQAAGGRVGGVTAVNVEHVRAAVVTAQHVSGERNQGLKGTARIHRRSGTQTVVYLNLDGPVPASKQLGTLRVTISADTTEPLVRDIPVEAWITGEE